MKGFHYLVSRTLTREDGVHAKGFGGYVGYWPCVRGPFIQIRFWIWRVSVWYGDVGKPENLK